MCFERYGTVGARKAETLPGVLRRFLPDGKAFPEKSLGL